jgi:hypothetical protein
VILRVMVDSCRSVGADAHITVAQKYVHMH